MTYAARIVWNIHKWEFPSGLTNHGVQVNHNNGAYNYGLEEWLNNKKFRDLKLGYLDCYRITQRQEKSVNLMLYTVDPADNHYYHIGSVYGVRQIDSRPDTIERIREQLPADWLTNTIDEDFKRIEHTPVDNNSNGLLIYNNNNWNSQNIISDPPGGFIVNFQYENISFFDRNNWVDLSEKDIEISTRWRHIRQRYSLLNPNFNNELIEYLSTI